MAPVIRILRDLRDTAAFAADVAKLLPPGSVLLLEGDLGAGKTTFVQSLARCYGITRTVTSPTFTLANEYLMPDGHALVHFDLYRLATPEGLYDLGFEDALEKGARIFIEWPEKARRVLELEAPNARVLRLEVVDEFTRKATLSD